MDSNSLAHTKWECKYHIVFAPKCIRINILVALKPSVKTDGFGFVQNNIKGEAMRKKANPTIP